MLLMTAEYVSEQLFANMWAVWNCGCFVYDRSRVKQHADLLSIKIILQSLIFL